MKYHQDIKSEIATRDKSFTACIDLGKTLLQRKLHDAAEVSVLHSRLYNRFKHLFYLEHSKVLSHLDFKDVSNAISFWK